MRTRQAAQGRQPNNAMQKGANTGLSRRNVGNMASVLLNPSPSEEKGPRDSGRQPTGAKQRSQQQQLGSAASRKAKGLSVPNPSPVGTRETGVREAALQMQNKKPRKKELKYRIDGQGIRQPLPQQQNHPHREAGQFWHSCYQWVLEWACNPN